MRGSARNLQQRRPKNDIHACNVYYAERPADRPRASDNAGRMSFVALRQYLRLAHRAGEIFQLTVEAADRRRLQASE